jgi:hypothetical protein
MLYFIAMLPSIACILVSGYLVAVQGILITSWTWGWFLFAALLFYPSNYHENNHCSHCDHKDDDKEEKEEED